MERVMLGPAWLMTLKVARGLPASFAAQGPVLPLENNCPYW